MTACLCVPNTQQIERCTADRSYGTIVTLLGDLDKMHVSAEQLETTDIVKVLYRLLKTCPDGSVKKAARGLLSGWKRQYSKERSVPELPCRPAEAVDGGDSGSGSSECAEPGASSGDSDGFQTAEGAAASCGFTSVRSKCVQLLLASLGPELPDQDKAAELARDIERHVHERHRSSPLKYKACVRSKVANLRNPKNHHLRQGLLSGSLSPEAFAHMSLDEMAGAELRQLREEYASRGVSERQLPQGVEGTLTRKIRCKRCGGSDCRVTQVSRGALFLPAWVRRGGPDDDAMTFVTCSGCGRQWYHSGWFCL
uniref:Uncharacterized protein n=1 Tax=Mola mola TaxID=94237 RepID=A0A3Q3X2P5_MOLML